MNSGVSAFRLEGSSMLPVFRPGEIAFVRPVGLAAGNCAVYSYEGGTLLHRVMKRGKNGAWFCDDAGRLTPHFVPMENIRGRVLSRNPLAGGLCGRIYSGLRRSLAPLFACSGRQPR